MFHCALPGDPSDSDLSRDVALGARHLDNSIVKSGYDESVPVTGTNAMSLLSSWDSDGVTSCTWMMSSPRPTIRCTRPQRAA